MTTVVGLNLKTLSTLVDWDAPLVVSAFIPIDFTLPQPTESITKNLRRLAQLASSDLIDQEGLSPNSAAMILSPLTDETHLDDVPENTRGLAVFVSTKRAMHVAAPITMGPAIEVSDRLDLLRLLPAVVDDVEFYALTIGKRGARLFRGRRYGFESVPVPDMPDAIDEALWYIRREPIRARVGSGVLHGSGGGEDLRKDDVRHYIHLIDKAVAPVLSGAVAPLVVIGVEYEASMFINDTHYQHVVDTPVLGSPESMSAGELHRRSWEFIGRQRRAADDALLRFRELAGTGKTAVEAAEVTAASHHGSVANLLIARSLTVDADTPPVPAAERRVAVEAVNECLRNRTTVHVVADASLPAGTRVAAVLRY